MTDPIAVLRAACGQAALCCRPGVWAVIVVATVVWIAALGLTAALIRTAWLGIGVHRALARQPRLQMSTELADALARTGLRNVVCLADPQPHAFCAGLFLPRVYLTSGLLGRLSGAALDAVLVHESEHVRSRDPLRRALGQALSEVFFFLPLVRWLASRQREDSEMRADRLAMRRVGRPALAAALLALSDPVGFGTMPAFTDADQLRVAQLLDDPLPQRFPAVWQWAVSALGLGSAIYLAFCPTASLLPR